MLLKENKTEKENGAGGQNSSSIECCSRASSSSQNSLEKDVELDSCRVCQCLESDKRGDVVLGFLGINPPQMDPTMSDGNSNPDNKDAVSDVESIMLDGKSSKVKSTCVEFVSPEGEVFVCSTDVEMGLSSHQSSLIKLGCSCKNDLALVHYACALKWFVNHGSTICEICGHAATNIRPADFKKVLASLKEYEALRERTASGVPNPAQVHDNSGVDPDAVAAIRRQRLSEISLWFNPRSSNPQNNNNNAPAVSQIAGEQPSNIAVQEVPFSEHPAAKWAVEGTGILLATGLLTVTLAWLIAPRVGKTTARNGLHILLGGVCALAVVVFFRFVVLTRIRYGPARYWAILFVFWFLVFGIWASRTHGAHTT